MWCSSINGDATLVATASADFTGKLWDATTGKMLHTFTEKHIVKSASLNSVQLYSGIYHRIHLLLPLAESLRK